VHLGKASCFSEISLQIKRIYQCELAKFMHCI